MVHCCMVCYIPAACAINPFPVIMSQKPETCSLITYNPADEYLYRPRLSILLPRLICHPFRANLLVFLTDGRCPSQMDVTLSGLSCRWASNRMAMHSPVGGYCLSGLDQRWHFRTQSPLNFTGPERD